MKWCKDESALNLQVLVQLMSLYELNDELLLLLPFHDCPRCNRLRGKLEKMTLVDISPDLKGLDLVLDEINQGIRIFG